MKRIDVGLGMLGTVIAFSAVAASAEAPPRIPLWASGAPGAIANGGAERVRVTETGEHVVSNVHEPSLTVYLPKSKGAQAACHVAE